MATTTNNGDERDINTTPRDTLAVVPKTTFNNIIFCNTSPTTEAYLNLQKVRSDNNVVNLLSGWMIPVDEPRSFDGVLNLEPGEKLRMWLDANIPDGQVDLHYSVLQFS